MTLQLTSTALTSPAKRAPSSPHEAMSLNWGTIATFAGFHILALLAPFFFPGRPWLLRSDCTGCAAASAFAWAITAC
ncbi:hypothetical protein KR51_00018720 [Rubidibacter lacunae KORDI 51-2]|uniref:Uncharacterized protein n=1 Tax=Rubidibacter lacunae KORDI 51-2 TaxID=582515 RepID=U5DLQ3_9CHRO|nr:hypothetical protein KR51_00018720 [Rubidibacter lacunae KORDI 51-2]